MVYEGEGESERHMVSQTCQASLQLHIHVWYWTLRSLPCRAVTAEVPPNSVKRHRRSCQHHQAVRTPYITSRKRSTRPTSRLAGGNHTFR
jgi:hypothetical protein